MEAELAARAGKLTLNMDSGVGGGRSDTVVVGETEQAINNAGCFDCHDYILWEILSRLPVKSLMKFKSACKHWRYLIEKDQHFIDLYNTRSEECQQHNTTLFISPVMLLCQAFVDRSTEDDVDREIKTISLTHNHRGRGSSPFAAPGHAFNSNITLPVLSTKDGPYEFVSCHTASLEPVHGLVCFLNLDNYGSILIYNPSTREKTTWIRTGTSKFLEDTFLDQTLRGGGLYNGKPLDMKTVYTCMFGFGYDSVTKKHKVLCIYQIHQKRNDSSNSTPDYQSYRGTCYEVMTVGENIWREIDGVPSFLQKLEIEEQCKSFHVNGFICWMTYKLYPSESNDVIMVFDVGSETFGTISIPTVILGDLWRLSWKERIKKWTNELVEVDGHIAILNIKKCNNGDHWIDLWILEDEIKINTTSSTSTGDGGGANWKLESLIMPYCWEQVHYLAFKAITGTDLIIIRFFLNSSSDHEPTKNEVLYCYNRKTKICYKKEVDMITDHTRPYDISTFIDTLTPVQTHTRVQ